jgi:hypothetical protein
MRMGKLQIRLLLHQIGQLKPLHVSRSKSDEGYKEYSALFEAWNSNGVVD